MFPNQYQFKNTTACQCIKCPHYLINSWTFYYSVELWEHKSDESVFSFQENSQMIRFLAKYLPRYSSYEKIFFHKYGYGLISNLPWISVCKDHIIQITFKMLELYLW